MGYCLVVRAGPGSHLHSVNHLLDVHHLKHRKDVPDDDPDISNGGKVDIVPRVGSDPSKHTCSAGCPLFDV